MVESETLPELNKKKQMKKSNKLAVAVKTRVNAGALTAKHNGTIAVKTKLSAGAPWGLIVGTL
jgi:hypothetical protein